MADQTDTRTFTDVSASSLPTRIATSIRRAVAEMSRLLQTRHNRRTVAKTDYFESAFTIERYREEARRNVDRLLY